MPYDFSCFDDKDFERFTRDVLNHAFNLDLQDFKGGKDQGRDLRCSTPENNNAIVVQAKHFRKSGYNKLLRHLQKAELPKVIKLSPDRYIVVTSLELSAFQKDQIREAMSPFIKNSNDVVGSEDLNKYLEQYDDIETRWYKLWMASTPVLNRILHNAVQGRSAFFDAKIRKTVRLYVHSQSYDDAFEILKNNKYILITGLPGVGKTTLAHLLTYHLLSQDFELVYIDTDVKDAETIFHADPSRKQVFFFDDFLGSNYLEIINPKTTETAFVNFLERIKNSDNRYLILTTRTIIFRNAIEKYEKLKRQRIDGARKEIELGHYSDVDKAKILYSHLYHSALSDDQLSEVFAHKNYMQIIKHRNYNPRLIEFITDVRNIPQANSSYLQFAMQHLENPEEVWRHAYEQQLTTEERLLIHAIFSMSGFGVIEDIKIVFEQMMRHEIQNRNHTPVLGPFQGAAKKLQDGMIKKEYHMYSSEERLEFVNPSLSDFLINYFISHEEERWNLMNSSGYVEQFEKYAQYFFGYSRKKINEHKHHLSRMALHLISQADTLECFAKLKYEKDRRRYILLRVCKLLVSFTDTNEEVDNAISAFAEKIIRNYPIESLNYDSYRFYMYVIRYHSFGAIEEFVQANWIKIVTSLSDTCIQLDDYDDLISLFEEYRMDYKAFLKVPDHYDQLEKNLRYIVDEVTADWIRDEQDAVLSEDDFEDMKESIRSKRNEFFKKYFIRDEFFDEDYYFPEDRRDEIIERNQSYVTERAKEPPFENKMVQAASNNEANEIEELFLVAPYPEEELTKQQSPF